MPTLNFDTPAFEWTPYKDEHFSVQVRCWKLGDKFCWNVYAHIFDTHRLHGDPDQAMELHFNGGATYDKYVTYEPSQGIQYDWQRVDCVLKVGSDYAHIWDDWAESCDPREGVPPRIQRDVLKLVEQLLGLQEVTA